VRYEHPLIASLLIGVAQEADLVSPGFEQSTAISNHSTLDYTLHYGEQRIVLPGGASWKRLCSSTVPPDQRQGQAGGKYAVIKQYCPTLAIIPQRLFLHTTQTRPLNSDIFAYHHNSPYSPAAALEVTEGGRRLPTTPIHGIATAERRPCS